MPAPSSSLATLRPDLGGSMEEFDLAVNRAGFIGTRVAPIFNVARASGNYGKIPIEQLLQSPDTERAPGSGYNRGKFTFEPMTFATREHGIEEPIDDNEAAIYADYFDAEMVAAQRARHGLLLGLETRISSLIFNSTTWTGSSLFTNVGTEWSTAASATPITDVEAAIRKVYTNSGIWPNAIVMTRLVFRNLRNCAQIIDRIEASGAGSAAKPSDITPSMIAQCFDLDEVIIGGSTKNTANPGQTASLAPIWDDEYVMVCHIDQSNDIRRPTLARTWHYTGDGSSEEGTMETYRDETIRGDVVRCRMQTGEAVVYTELGHLLGNITA